MQDNFELIKPEEITENPFMEIGTNWMLITSGQMDNMNTMTAAWGCFGVLWHLNIAQIFVRPQRYTYQYLERNKLFTLSFFEEKHKNILQYCGRKSGKDTDKIKDCNLTPFLTNQGGIGFDQAKQILVCKKLFYSDIDPNNFLDSKTHVLYPLKDYHRMYTAEVIEVLRAK